MLLYRRYARVLQWCSSPFTHLAAPELDRYR